MPVGWLSLEFGMSSETGVVSLVSAWSLVSKLRAYFKLNGVVSAISLLVACVVRLSSPRIDGEREKDDSGLESEES
jgi:hypothetical protein